MNGLFCFQAYFVDYLKLAKLYHVTEVEVPKINHDSEEMEARLKPPRLVLWAWHIPLPGSQGQVKTQLDKWILAKFSSELYIVIFIAKCKILEVRLGKI